MTSTSEFHVGISSCHSYVCCDLFCVASGTKSPLSSRHTEDSHVKTNLVHTLFRVRKYGLMPLDKFSEVLSPSDIRRCKQIQKKTWYTLPLNIFTSFIFQVMFFTSASILYCSSHSVSNYIMSTLVKFCHFCAA